MSSFWCFSFWKLYLFRKISFFPVYSIVKFPHQPPFCCQLYHHTSWFKKAWICTASQIADFLVFNNTNKCSINFDYPPFKGNLTLNLFEQISKHFLLECFVPIMVEICPVVTTRTTTFLSWPIFFISWEQLLFYFVATS